MSTTTEPVSSSPPPSKGYVKPDVLVTTEWVAQHLNDPKVRILESDEDVLLYDLGHIPGAQKIDWHTDLNDSLVRDYVSKEQFQALLRRLGIDDSTTVVFYGDKNNWWATYAFWVFQLFGFTNAKVVDGGRAKWEQEGRPFSTDVPKYPATQYVAQGARRLEDPRVQGRDAGAQPGEEAADRRALAGRVQRQEDAHARVSAGRRAARRAHPGREERSVGARGEPGRHVQDGGRAARDL